MDGHNGYLALDSCRGGCQVSLRLCRVHVPTVLFSHENETKFSKQSALAVQQFLSENQHQSTGMFKYALA